MNTKDVFIKKYFSFASFCKILKIDLNNIMSWIREATKKFFLRGPKTKPPPPELVVILF